MVNREPNDKVLVLPTVSPAPAQSRVDFSVWVQAHQPRLLALARRLVWDTEEARDGNGPVDEDVQVR